MENQREVKVALDQQEMRKELIANSNKRLGKDTPEEEIKNDPTVLTPDGYRHCKLNIGVMYANNVFQFKNDLLLTDAEAYNAYRLMTTKIEQLANTGYPVSFSMKARNLDRKIVCRCYSCVVYIEHDIPEIADVTEDEDV